ncbi:MAG: sugar phosphate isomerase/epimerase [Clostridiales Family XIII bacterium]|jgi:2-keto-myo-inositol isomerase|nr:sugar phosphate isomerase/epimerase [Clostridiales Family XIII bacterium]
MKLSFNEATARDCSSLELDLTLCEQAGFDFIEIRFDMLRDYLKTHTVRELKTYFETHRIKPHAFNALYLFDTFLAGERCRDKAREKRVMDDFMLACEVGREIGAHYLVVVPDLYREAPNTRPYINTRENINIDAVRILGALSDVARDYGMNLGLEPVGSLGCSVKTIGHAMEIVRLTDRENVGLTADCFNLYLYAKRNDFSDIGTVDPAKIFVVHVNNADCAPIGVLSNEHRRFCDSGVIDLKSYLGVLRDMGYDGMISIEVFRPEYWAWPAEKVVSEAYRTTRDAVARYGRL